MSRLVDPTICPDCRATLGPEGTCTGCGLQLRGEAAVELWSTMLAADRLVERLRAASTPAGPAYVMPGLPPPLPATAPARPGRKLPALSVPVVLLSLGGLCLLVAAVVFVAVTWSLLGLTGRTLVLLAVTALLAALATVLTRRGLRGAAETLWLVVAGMLVVDLLGAQRAGLLGLDALGWRGTSALVGGGVLAVGGAVAWWARSQPVRRLYGAQAVGLAGAVVLTGTNGWAATQPAVGTAVATALLLAGALVTRRTLPLLSAGSTGLGVVSWLVLLGLGWSRASEAVSPGTWWTDLRGWPLVVAAVLAATGTWLLPRTRALRELAAVAALVPVVVLANAPYVPAAETRTVLLACASVVALALVARLAPLVWARAGAALAVLGTGGLLLLLLGTAATVLAGLPGAADPGGAAVDLTVPAAEAGFEPWLAGVIAVSVALALAGVLRVVPEARRAGAGAVVVVLAAAAAGLGAADIVLGLRPPLWAGVLALGLATALTAGTTWPLRDRLPAAASGSAGTAVLGALTLVAAAPSHLLEALVSSVMALLLTGAFLLRDQEQGSVSTALCGVLAGLLGGLGLVEWGLMMGADAAARTLALAAYAGLLGLVAAPASRRTAGRSALEVAAALLALVAIGSGGTPATLAMSLTIVGAAICVMAVLNRDRSALGWLGAAVLAGATAVRVLDDVSAPELYTLPMAALLVGAGLWRLDRDRDVDSFSVLGSGLGLALLPSLVLALDDPVSVRGALVAAGGLLSLGLGVVRRLAAPFALGALTTGLLALRHLEPVADAVPRWISLGLVGLVLLAVGISWEARLRDLRTARRYLTALR